FFYARRHRPLFPVQGRAVADRVVLAPRLAMVRRDDDERVLVRAGPGRMREEPVERRVEVRERLVVSGDEVLAVARGERDVALAVHLPEQRLEKRAGRTRGRRGKRAGPGWGDQDAFVGVEVVHEEEGRA